MAVLKCKMCGGDIIVNEEKTYGMCDYCGSTMTLPKVSDDQRAARFNRGNHFRRQGDFDKALAVYESIVREDDTDAEAHWCCALCRFGIEYVEDPNTYEYLPTCHRASFDSFTEDVDYLAALDNSDGITRRQYQKDAAKIAEVQRGILATSQNEEPYDVFICYKETDDQTKERTRDSLDAQEIYYQLTQEGYRVFFSRITLEDKVGAEYEPYIFAALNSAKVMVAIGSKPEYFNAVWVKNEWSRFLAMMRKDRSKLLLPCYKGMDPYDLPEQLGVLQSYDMTKIGFIQDLIRGVKKVLKKDEPKVTVVKEVSAGGGNVESLLKRTNMFLEDEEWSSAEEYAQKVLDIDPENAEAYLGLVLAKDKLRNKEEFASRFIDDRIETNDKNLKRARQFADEKLKDWFSELNKAKAEADAKKIEEQERKQAEERARREELNKQAEEKARIQAEENARKKEKERARFEENKKRLAPAIRQVSKYRNLISAGFTYSVGLKADGTVVAIGLNVSGECDVASWRDIVAVSAGDQNTVGLKADGTVVAVGSKENGRCDVAGWKDIVAVSAGWYHTVGLKADGTVVATDYTGEYYNGQCDVTSWTDIVAVSAGGHHTVGLKADGTVVATKYTDDVECYFGQCDVAGWRDIVAVSAGWYHTVGLKANGTVIAVGINENGRCDVSDWTDIVAVSAGSSHTVGLKADGTVVATDYTGEYYNGQCDVTSWTDIVAVSAGGSHTIGLKSDGTVVATEDTGENEDDFDDCRDVASWKLFKSEEEKEADYTKARSLQDSGEEQKLTEASSIFRGLKDYKDSADHAAECDRAYRGLKAEREKREREKKTAELNSEKTALQTELANLKGIFSGKRRRQIEARLAEIEMGLKNM